jgi:hypothetical protein
MARARFPRNGYALSLLLALNSSAALAQTPSPDSDGPQSQIWANVTAGTLRGPHWYVELDFEPKWQASSPATRAAFIIWRVSSSTGARSSVSTAASGP